jgi:rRNA pseudouridine-1189 N-methylase Emg1 (Nep1/Mra1 family)
MPAKKKASSRRQKPEIVHQFLVALTRTDPLITGCPLSVL